MSNFNTQIGGGQFHLQFTTTDKDQFIRMQQCARECVDGVDSVKHWMPVTERLPERKGLYLVSYHPCYWDDVKETVDVRIDSYRGGDGKRCWARNKYQRVTHWMPLPEPPEKENYDGK